MEIATPWGVFNLAIAAVILVAYVIVDGMYAYYTFEVVKRRPYRAATIGALMHFLIAFGVLNYVRNFLYILPLVFGSWIGTFIVVAREKRREEDVEKQ